jgi:hypothetical protein
MQIVNVAMRAYLGGLSVDAQNLQTARARWLAGCNYDLSATASLKRLRDVLTPRKEIYPTPFYGCLG